MESKDEVDRLLEDGAEPNIIKDVEVTLRDEVSWHTQPCDAMANIAGNHSSSSSS